MVGGGLGPYQPGEFSDDTQMAVCIASVLAQGIDSMGHERALDAIARNFLTWRREGASDIGVQCSTVLRMTEQAGASSSISHQMTEVSKKRYEMGELSAGNGSLMRTGPVGLIALDDPHATAVAARRISTLTHADPLAEEACVIWSEGIRHAVMTGSFDGVRLGLDHLPAHRAAQWAAWLDEAEINPPHRFQPNGFVVSALQAAWSAIFRTPVPANDPATGSFATQHFRAALEAAVRSGDDTDTVAAIAGALLGARWGASAVPYHWQRAVHGWPGVASRDLVALAVSIARGGTCDKQGWPLGARIPLPADERERAPFVVAHPHDPGVFLGNLSAAEQGRFDAVVSLCRLGLEGIPGPVPSNHVQMWLIDRTGQNADVHYVVDQAARAVAALRSEGKRVLLHCAAGRSRTPTVAARYSALLGHPTAIAIADIVEVLRPHRPCLNPELEQALYTLAGEEFPVRDALPWYVLNLRQNGEEDVRESQEQPPLFGE